MKTYAYEEAVSSNSYVDKVTATKNNVATETRTDKFGNLLTLKVKEGAGAQTTYLTNTFHSDGRQNNSTDNLTGSVITYAYNSSIKEQIDSVTRTAGTNAAALTETNRYNAMGQIEYRGLSVGGQAI